MATFLLIMIYLAFISLGLPDSLLGAAWPVMQSDYGEPLETAGYLYMCIAAGTILSSLASGWMNNKLGTGKVTFISVTMTAVALLGFSYSPSLIWLIICAIPLGLGAGAVDASLNNYVALHYKAHHMSWLHCFWGVGASVGPMVMAFYIVNQGSWRSGYLTIAIIQFSLAILLLFALPLWALVARKSTNESEHIEGLSEVLDPTVKPLKIKGVKFALMTFFFLCGAESTMGLWGSSYLVNSKGLSAAEAAKWVSFFFIGMTIGRLISGFITMKVSNKVLIRSGQLTALSGAALILLPLPIPLSLTGFIFVGLGLAPIYPCLIHETPIRFGKVHSQSIIGYQMALAYTGTTFLPPLLGIVASKTTLWIFPVFILIYILGMFVSSEKVNRIIKIRSHSNNINPSI
ncbi:MFS transporter [Peribacillus psychrosaccharolyticus]|uniref:MFS transporter n=1 Tax=Peribacillus psychrosaccharolyticus TaxID=1407 RepID=UPI003D2D7C6C